MVILQLILSGNTPTDNQKHIFLDFGVSCERFNTGRCRHWKFIAYDRLKCRWPIVFCETRFEVQYVSNYCFSGLKNHYKISTSRMFSVLGVFVLVSMIGFKFKCGQFPVFFPLVNRTTSSETRYPHYCSNDPNPSYFYASGSLLMLDRGTMKRPQQ